MVVKWWEQSPPTNVPWVQFPGLMAYMGWVCCWFSPLLQEVFLWVLRFSPLLKNQHFQFPIRPGIEEPLCGCATSKSLFILLIFLYFEVYTISEYNEQWVALLSMHPLNISRTGFEVYTISEYNEQWVALLSMHPLNISRTGFGYHVFGRSMI